MADRLDRELARLRAIGVGIQPVAGARGADLRRRLCDVFVVPEERERVLEPTRTLPLESLLRMELQKPRPLGSAVEWLARRDAAWLQVVRFDRAPERIHAIDARTIEATWLLSWPALYVAEDLRRAVAVGVDYEVVFCDATADARPYR